eukprot:CAMPEP_0172303958 /NCGR_PEP_ID=MMETSP1058-20130122/5433_1 /TAXON_ID=83371 /ORGANISM="Detonula confervacea, Strain CCMP 353" /LENGTH=249 /DNA_ID=CAMNT_0013014995 /DNA_START=257 /DNA_END=1006 /DNA_ORIENTATION=+
MASAASSGEQCHGYTPMPSIATFLGTELSYSTAQRICCNNHKYAEYSGYLAAPEVDLFGKLDPQKETVFYDSVCGIPLFIAPRGRSFEEFKEESLKHGWPSFRPEELVSENVIIHGDGRMESRCLTHLGHNLPEGGVDRYCIDLVCMAGTPFAVDSDDERAKILTMVDEMVIDHHELNTTSYKSSAESFSGKYNDWSSKLTIIGVVCAAALVAAGMIAYLVSAKKGKADKKCKEVEPQGTEDVMDVDLS